MAAYGLYSHIQSNRRRSIALLVGLFFLIYLMVYAGALAAEALSVNADTDVLMRLAWNDFLQAAPWATIGTALLKKRRDAAILFSRSESSACNCWKLVLAFRSG